MLFWGMLEANLGLLACCLPTLRGLVKARPVNSFVEGYRSMTWLKSSAARSGNRSGNRSGGEHDGLPLANSPVRSAKQGPIENKSPHVNGTLTTVSSASTYGQGQLR